MLVKGWETKGGKSSTSPLYTVWEKKIAFRHTMCGVTWSVQICTVKVVILSAIRAWLTMKLVCWSKGWIQKVPNVLLHIIGWWRVQHCFHIFHFISYRCSMCSFAPAHKKRKVTVSAPHLCLVEICRVAVCELLFFFFSITILVSIAQEHCFRKIYTLRLRSIACNMSRWFSMFTMIFVYKQYVSLY